MGITISELHYDIYVTDLYDAESYLETASRIADLKEIESKMYEERDKDVSAYKVKRTPENVIQDLVFKMIAYLPEDRPSAKEAIKILDKALIQLNQQS